LKKILLFYLITIIISFSYPLNSKNTEILLNKEYSVKVFKYLKKAKKNVIISAYMWCCNPEKYYSIPCKMLNIVINLVKKGVDVTIIFDRDVKSDSECNIITSKILKHTLFKKKYHNLHIYFDSPVVRSHEKLILVDGKYSFIGSHNITQSAFKYNNEVSVFIKSESVYKKLKKYLDKIISVSSKIY